MELLHDLTILARGVPGLGQPLLGEGPQRAALRRSQLPTSTLPTAVRSPSMGRQCQLFALCVLAFPPCRLPPLRCFVVAAAFSACKIRQHPGCSYGSTGVSLSVFATLMRLMRQFPGHIVLRSCSPHVAVAACCGCVFVSFCFKVAPVPWLCGL